MNAVDASVFLIQFATPFKADKTNHYGTEFAVQWKSMCKLSEIADRGYNCSEINISM